jgi:hypothetical protein
MVNVFSFCLYGAYNVRYYPGMIENIESIRNDFPDWKVYVYIAPDITSEMKRTLQSYDTVVLRETDVLGPINMIRRFFAIDEDGVDVMFVRDADSRVFWKDRWAIQDFMRRPEFVAHAIRDNRVHTSRMMGGLWGIRRSAGLSITDEYGGFQGRDYGFGHDQSFLCDVIYPKVKDKLLVHYSNQRRFEGEHAIEFPYQWSVKAFCGMVVMDVRYMPDSFVEKQQTPVFPFIKFR